MYVLGIGCYYHDASAALMKNGIFVAAAEEERFTRVKHDPSFPINAIRYCLEKENITIKEISYLAFYEKPMLKFERVLSQHIEGFPKSMKVFLGSMPSWLTEKLTIPKKIEKELGFKEGIVFVEHHMAHSASAFFLSPFRKAAIVTVDGVGEWATTTYGLGEENRIKTIEKLEFPHSIGLLYSTITAYLGFSVNNSEYKVMGLSAYGEKDKSKNPYYRKLRQTIDIREDGSFALEMDYFKYHYSDKMPSGKLCRLLEGKIRKKNERIEKRHMDIAAGLQMIAEEALSGILKRAHKKTKCDSLVMAGGVALNSVFNGKIARLTPFKKIWIQPNASDGGASMGAAAYVYHSLLGKKRTTYLKSASLGPEYSDSEIRLFLERNNIIYKEFKSKEELVKEAAKKIYSGKIIGWFQGRMEWGPRALGSRSILANPCIENIKDILNKKVKKREEFRPFAPSVCREDAAKYFDIGKRMLEPFGFMLMVCPVKKEYIKSLPSVVHIDNTARVHAVGEENLLFRSLIKEFGKISGIPVIVNTSFNIRGEPIVCSPEDAYNCMMGTEIDCIFIGSFMVERGKNNNAKLS